MTDQNTDIITTEPEQIAVYQKPPAVNTELVELAWRVGKGMSLATVAVGKICRNNEGNAFAVALQALRWGMDPFAVSHECYDVKGNLAYSGKLISAVIHANAPIEERLDYEYKGEGEERQVIVSATFTGEKKAKTYTSPKIKDIPIKNSPLWKNDPDQQLSYYGARNWARKHASDIMLGVLSTDEAEVIPMRDVTPREINALHLDVSDLQQSGEEESFEEAEVLPEAPETNAKGDDQISEADVPEETPSRSAVFDALDVFIETPNARAFTQVWMDHLREAQNCPDLMYDWTELQQHAAFRLLAEDEKGFIQKNTNKRFNALEGELEH